MAEGRTGGDSYTPTEAALILRVTPTRVRQLLQDGELEGERDEAGHWLIPARAVHERAQRLRRESFLEAVGYDLSGVREMQELIEELRDRVRSLEGQLSEEREARRRADTLMDRLMDRVPAIGATQEAPPEAFQPRQEPQPDTVGPQEATQETARRPWWLRWLGG